MLRSGPCLPAWFLCVVSPFGDFERGGRWVVKASDGINAGG